MALKALSTRRLVKSEDLNHHKTLFAGRCSEWFVESCFVAVATALPPQNTVCLKIHGMEFLHPIHSGDILTFESKIISNGRSTLTVYCKVYKDSTPEDLFCEGFATFVHVDDNTRPQPHGIVIVPETDEETNLNAIAKELTLVSKKKK
ncbi:acyl-CoA thioesterase [Bacteroidales bacterium OttesenSCG-928-B11]|nr:acyl-CoA thioesterase [Bacteroidales bacterium OttesenSCG-928-C03]MDL2312721.1 acyl-CoA thioesterase [Bacteroidales bacterium OttesenSCG-928-B11]MDL2326423.1 acyl-CoA thioesterase [Bacteroidales bacterium OttesenSCG-928-A14]